MSARRPPPVVDLVGRSTRSLKDGPTPPPRQRPSLVTRLLQSAHELIAAHTDTRAVPYERMPSSRLTASQRRDLRQLADLEGDPAKALERAEAVQRLAAEKRSKSSSQTSATSR